MELLTARVSLTDSAITCTHGILLVVTTYQYQERLATAAKLRQAVSRASRPRSQASAHASWTVNRRLGGCSGLGRLGSGTPGCQSWQIICIT